MRVFLALPLLLVAACSVQHDNGQTTVQFNGQSVDNAVSDVGNAADQAASDVGNAAKGLENDVNNVHVDINTGHDKQQGNSH